MRLCQCLSICMWRGLTFRPAPSYSALQPIQLHAVLLYYIVSIHLYSAFRSVHQSEALPLIVYTPRRRRCSGIAEQLCTKYLLKVSGVFRNWRRGGHIKEIWGVGTSIPQRGPEAEPLMEGWAKLPETELLLQFQLNLVCNSITYKKYVCCKSWNCQGNICKGTIVKCIHNNYMLMTSDERIHIFARHE